MAKKTIAKSCIRTSISINFILGEAGIVELIVGIKATKASTKTAMVAILLENAGYWKNTKSPINPVVHSGMKMVKILFIGYW